MAVGSIEADDQGTCGGYKNKVPSSVHIDGSRQVWLDKYFKKFKWFRNWHNITWLYRHFKKASYSIALVVLLEWRAPVYAVSKGMYSLIVKSFLEQNINSF